jgi:hypothetical protein
MTGTIFNQNQNPANIIKNAANSIFNANPQFNSTFSPNSNQNNSTFTANHNSQSPIFGIQQNGHMNNNNFSTQAPMSNFTVNTGSSSIFGNNFNNQNGFPNTQLNNNTNSNFAGVNNSFLQPSQPFSNTPAFSGGAFSNNSFALPVKKFEAQKSKNSKIDGKHLIKTIMAL